MDCSVLVYAPFLGRGASAYRYTDRRIYEYPYIRYSLYASFFVGLCSFSVPSHKIRDCASLRCGYCGSIREQVVSTHSLMASGGRSSLHVGTIRPPRPLLTHRYIGTGTGACQSPFCHAAFICHRQCTMPRIATSSDAAHNSILAVMLLYLSRCARPKTIFHVVFPQPTGLAGDFGREVKAAWIV